MDIFRDQISFLRKVKDQAIFQVMQETIQQSGFVIKDFIVNKQLFREGERGDGKKLRAYKRTTIRIKIKKGQPTDRTTLHDTQTFVNSIMVDAYNDRFEISSDVDYAKYIIAKYGEEVLHPSNDNMREFMNNYYIPKLRQKIKSLLIN